MPTTPTSRRCYAAILSLLTGLFFLRVLGQVLVAFLNVNFLPDMDHWYSGLIPYSVLLPIQIVMLVMMAKICRDISRGTGFFALLRTRGTILRIFSIIYASSMAIRYVVTMIAHPELRWFGGTIPIFFHFVLAGFLFTLGSYHTQTGK